MRSVRRRKAVLLPRVRRRSRARACTTARRPEVEAEGRCGIPERVAFRPVWRRGELAHQRLGDRHHQQLAEREQAPGRQVAIRGVVALTGQRGRKISAKPSDVLNSPRELPIARRGWHRLPSRTATPPR